MLVNWQEIETVLFDMDGTLLDLHYDNHFWRDYLPEKYALKHKLSLAETKKNLAKAFDSTYGTLNFYCVEYWSNTLDIEIVTLKREADEKIRFLPGAEQLLQQVRLQPHSPKLAIATNAHREVFNIKDEKLKLSARVDDVFCANEFGSPKEENHFWEKLQDVFAFDPERTLLIDDNQSVLTSAKEYGIAHLVLPLNPDSQNDTQTNKIGCTAIESLEEILPSNTFEPATR